MSESFPLVSLRAKRIKKRQPIQHAVAAAILVMTGVDHLQHGASHSAIPYLEIAAGVTLLALVIAERIRHHLFRGSVAWVEFAGAVMMFVEAIAKLEQRHHVSFYVLSFVPPILLMTFAVFDARIGEMRRLTATESGLSMRLRLYSRRSVGWQDVASWSRGEKSVDVTLRSGKTTRFRFNDVENASEAMTWTEERFARYASPAHQLPARDRDADQREQHEVLVSQQRGSE